MQIHPDTTIGTVTLRVQNLAAMRDFYARTVGLCVHAATADAALLGTETAVLLRLLRLANGRFPLPHAAGLYHLALRVPTRADLGHWLRHYARRGAPYWQGGSDHGVSDALYLSDPEGNGIEITCDHPRSRWTFAAGGQIVALLHRLDLDALIQTAPADRWRRLPAGTDLGHVHLKVSDLAAARAFYVDVLGFGVQTAYQNSALFLAAGGYHHHIGLNTWQSRGGPPPPPDAYGLAEVTVRLPDTAVLATIQARLAASSIPYTLTATGDCLVQDPAGLSLRLTGQPFEINHTKET
ncbi:MAG: VOC family protein [Anaerolineales bacterium]|nr:VOC family protein [Anaerolineales bacterium]